MSFGDDSYHTQFLRERVVAMIEEAKENSKGSFQKTSEDMEAFIYQQSTCRSEYMSIVAGTIQYLKQQKGPGEEAADTQVNGESSQQNGASAEADKADTAHSAGSTSPNSSSPN